MNFKEKLECMFNYTMLKALLETKTPMLDSILLRGGIEMDITDFKEGEEFLLVSRMPYGNEILGITECKCHKILKTCIKIDNNRKIEKHMFKDCYPLEEYQTLNQQRQEYQIKKYKKKFQEEKKTRFELICIAKAVGQLLEEKNVKK